MSSTYERVKRVLLSVPRANSSRPIEVTPTTNVHEYFGLYDGAEFFVELAKEFEADLPEINLIVESLDCNTLQELADFIDQEKSKLVTQGE